MSSTPLHMQGVLVSQKSAMKWPLLWIKLFLNVYLLPCSFELTVQTYSVKEWKFCNDLSSRSLEIADQLLWAKPLSSKWLLGKPDSWSPQEIGRAGSQLWLHLPCQHSTTKTHTKDFNNGNHSKSTPQGAGMCFLDKQTTVGKSLAVKVQAIASRWEEEQSKLWQWLQFPLGTVSGFPGVTPAVVRLRRPQNSQHFAPVLPPLPRLASYGELK